MNKLYYSLPQRRWIQAQGVHAVVQQRQMPWHAFYSYCVNTFPLVTGKLTGSQKAALRNNGFWQPEPETDDSLRSNHYDLLRMRGAHQVYVPNAKDPAIRANTLPKYDAHIPLLPHLRAVGAAVYGADDFMIDNMDILQRPAGNYRRVIGSMPHNDMDFNFGLSVRCLSQLAITADALLGQQKDGRDIDKLWWPTRYTDMRTMPVSEIPGWQEKLGFIFPQSSDIAAFLERYPHYPMPVNRHILMPSWMFHMAGGSADEVPPHYKDSDQPMPKAYISHTIMYAPMYAPRG